MSTGKTGHISAKEAEKQGKISQEAEKDFNELLIILRDLKPPNKVEELKIIVKFLFKKIHERTYHE